MGNSLKNAPRRVRLAAMALLLTSCAGADARPDEFSLEVGSGWGDESGAVGARDFDSSGDGQWIAVGWTWYLGGPSRPARAAAPLGPMAPPDPPPPAAPQPEAAPEPVDEPPPVAPVDAQPWPWTGLPVFAGVLAASAAGVAGWTYREAVWSAIRAAAGWAWSWLGRLLRRARPARTPRR